MRDDPESFLREANSERSAAIANRNPHAVAARRRSRSPDSIGAGSRPRTAAVKPSSETRPIEFWGGTTDPELHRDDAFLYTVRAWMMRRPYEFSLPRNETKVPTNAREQYVVDKFVGETLVDLLARPGAVHEQRIVAQSVVNQDNIRLCHGSFGIITKNPRNTIVACSPKDLHSEDFDLFKINKMRKSAKKQEIDASEVLDQMTANESSGPVESNNEILAIGTYKGCKIETQAVFYLEDPFGTPYQPYLVNKLKESAGRSGLRVVPFKHKSRGEFKIENHSPIGFSARIDGILYDFGEKMSSVSARYLNPRPMTGEQFIAIQNVLRDNDISQDEIDQLTARLARSNEYCHRPHFTFDHDGKVESLLQADGNLQYILHVVKRSGAVSLNAAVIHDNGMAKKYKLEWSPSELEYQHPQALTAEEIDTMFVVARNQLSEADRSKADQWLKERTNDFAATTSQELSAQDAQTVTRLTNNSDRIIDRQSWLVF